MKLSRGGSYIKADGVLKGSVIKFLDEGNIEVSDKYTYDNGDPKKALVFLVSLNGEEKKLRLNTQSKVGLIEAWGDETKNWIGRSARINIFPTPNGDKKMIVLEAMEVIVKEAKDIAWEP